MEPYLKRTWAEIDLDAVRENFRLIKAQVKPSTKVCCVIKADAYGHGAERLAQVYEQAGADWFAVSNLEEAEQLRRAGTVLPILILGHTPPCDAKRLAENDIAQAVVGSEYAQDLSREAVRDGVTVHVHRATARRLSRWKRPADCPVWTRKAFSRILRWRTKASPAHPLPARSMRA